MIDALAKPDSPLRRWSLWLAAALPLLIGACVMAWESDGVYHDDDLMHFLMARWSWTDPVFLLHDWGRPGFTVPYALIAWIGDYETGMMACRFLTIALAGASAVLACATAYQMRVRHAWLAGVALLAMPLYFRLSYATLTETVCGFYLILGTWLLSRGSLRAAAAALALAPLARHEAVVFLLPIAGYFLWRRQWTALLLLAWAEAAWNVLSLKWYWMLPITRYLQGKPIERYGEGGLLHYFLMWGSVTTPVLLALTVGGGALVLWRTWRDSRAHGLLREVESNAAGFYVVLGVAGMIAVQTLLYYRNTFASGGYPRFLVPAGPWMAVLAAAALDCVIVAMLARTRGMFAGARRHDTAIRCVGAATAISLAAVWLASRAELPQQSEWMIRGLYSGWPGLYVERYTWWLVGACVVMAAWPRKPAMLAVIALSVWWVGNVGWQTREPLFLTPGERLIKQGIDAAAKRAQARGEAMAIRGQSPWVDYYIQRDGKTSDPSAADWWLQSEPGEAKFLLLDNDYTPRGELREKIDAVDHTKVFSRTLGEAFPDAYQYWYHVEVLERK